MTPPEGHPGQASPIGGEVIDALPSGCRGRQRPTFS